MRHVLLPTVLFLAMFSFLRADALKIGDAAPVVSGLATDAGTTIDLADIYKKSAYTLVYFYPKADTPGCTAQGCSLRDGFDELTKKGVVVLGVSTDSVEAQKKFKEKNKFPFLLVADTDKKVIKAFGQSSLVFASREAYLIKDGKVVYHDTGVTTKQAENVLNFLSRETPAAAPAAKPATPPAPAPAK
jgi:peroxiredoxin Q/BCP